MNVEKSIDIRRQRIYARTFKRPLDVLCACAAIGAFSWLYLLIALLVRIKLGKPIIFKQARPGLNEKIFNLYKFRTMTNARDKDGALLPDAERLTRFGKFLRSTSLDEIPEAFNILKGDMSVVGPRPLLVKYLPFYNEEQRKRHNVRPGLTGLAQVSGRNTLTWEEKFNFDVAYVQNVSFAQDFSIVLKTVWKAFRREGITAKDSVSTPEFIGSENSRYLSMN